VKTSRNIILYRIHALFNEPLFWGPVLILSLQKLAHMSLPNIYFMESAILCVCVLCDIPSGALADLIGRKKTVILGRAFLLGSAVMFTVMTNPLQAWIGNILWALGFSLQSGADTALLYESLKEQGSEGEYKRIEGQAIGTRLIVIACCVLAAGFLAKINLRLPMYLSLPFVLIPLISAFFFKEPAKTERFSAQKQLKVLKQGVMFALRSTNVRWMVGFAALLATTSKVWFFTYNPYFEKVQIPLEYYGIIFFLLNVVAWLSSHFAYKIEHKLGERACIAMMVFCVGVPIMLMTLFPSQPFAYLVLVQNVVRGFMKPFVGDYMNRHIATEMRATVLSVQSSAANLVSVIGLAVFGLFTANFSLLTSLLILGIIALTLGAWSYRSYVKYVT
jgi:MFS family permease